MGPELLCVLRSWASCDQQWTCCLCLLQGPAASVCGSAGPPSIHCQPEGISVEVFTPPRCAMLPEGLRRQNIEQMHFSCV